MMLQQCAQALDQSTMLEAWQITHEHVSEVLIQLMHELMSKVIRHLTHQHDSHEVSRQQSSDSPAMRQSNLV
jgi:hypothetical protein